MRTIYNGGFIFTIADWTSMPAVVSYENGNSASVTDDDRRRLAEINLGVLETAFNMYREPFKTYEPQIKALESAIERLHNYLGSLS